MEKSWNFKWEKVYEPCVLRMLLGIVRILLKRFVDGNFECKFYLDLTRSSCLKCELSARRN